MGKQRINVICLEADFEVPVKIGIFFRKVKLGFGNGPIKANQFYIKFSEVHHAYAESDRRRANRAVMDLEPLGRSLAFYLRGQMTIRDLTRYVPVQVTGAVIGVWLTHIMYGEDIIQFSTTARTGPSQWVSEVLATFGLLFVIFGGLRYQASVPALVAIYITGAYWFTSSTSFANPAVTFARGFSDTFAGIYPGHIAMFVVAQLIAVLIAHGVFKWLLKDVEPEDD